MTLGRSSCGKGVIDTSQDNIKYISIRVTDDDVVETLSTMDEEEAVDWIKGYHRCEIWEDDHLYAREGLGECISLEM